MPEPVTIPSLGQLDETHDAKLVAVTATVRDIFKTEEGTALLLAGSSRTLQARLPDDVEPPPSGAQVRITGIYHVEAVAATSGFTSSPVIASLRSRSADDIVVLRPPPWWTARRLAAVLAALAGITALAGLWIAALRRQVGRQTAALRKRIEAEAALEERQRIAREFHDTLEQELAGVSLRLDALATRGLDEKGRSLATGARNLVSRMQSETRDLISDLRDPTETAGDLVAALASVAARQSTDTDTPVRLESGSAIAPLPPAVVHHLRMIAREAVTNAIKHGRATHVQIGVDENAGEVVLRVADNGCGFDATLADQQKRGHFGCAGMRERARKIGAEVTWRSVLQRGTTVEVRLPMATSRVPTAIATEADSSLR
jgi:signal transduction histidine kinase